MPLIYRGFVAAIGRVESQQSPQGRRKADPVRNKPQIRGGTEHGTRARGRAVGLDASLHALS